MKTGIYVLRRLLLCAVAVGMYWSTNATAQDFRILKSFGVLTNVTGWNPQSHLLQGPDGALYGTTSRGDGNIAGTIFKVQPDGSGFVVLKSFTNSADGASPHAGLTLSGTTLFGTTYSGGSSGQGTVFQVNTDGTGYTVLQNFNGTNGANPQAGLTLSGSTLYGTTYYGGSSNYGTVFKVSTDGSSYTVLKSIDGKGDGKWPRAGLTLSDSTLYGTTSQGGSSYQGTIFKLNTDGTGYTVLKNFGNPSDGWNPEAALILVGSVLYGTTSRGGSLNFGTVFKLNTNGTGYTVLQNFDGAHGANPQAGLTLSGNTVCGTTSGGGASGFGTVFKVDTNGTGYAVLKSFSTSDAVFPVGLTLSGNTLYGTTSEGGTSGNGTVFKVDKDGTGYTVLKDFNGVDGANPREGPTLSDGMLYGTTSGGGSFGFGTVFKMNIDGTGYTVLQHFDGTNGDNPGALTLSGNALYGTTYYGGSSAGGTVFKVNTDGTGITVLMSFAGFNDFPVFPGALTLSGNTLYGTTPYGGSLGQGTVFKVDTDGTGYTVIKSFSSFNLQGNPRSLTLSGSTLFGTTISDGFGSGTLFKMNTDGTGYTVLKAFPYPPQGLTLLNGTLYGTTYGGGSSGFGTVIKMSIDGSGYTMLKDFSGPDGANPQASLTLSGGTLYGTTSHGGDLGAGTVFALDIVPPTPSFNSSFQWARFVAGTTNQDSEVSIGLATDSAGDVYVTGWFDGTNDYGGVTLTNQSGGGQDVFVAKYNSAGTVQWARRAGGSTAERDGGRGVGVDSSGNVYVTGEFFGTADFGGITLNAPLNKEFFLIQYNNAGTLQWARQSVGGRSSGVYGTGLAVDSVGNSYAVGFADNGAAITFGTTNLLNASGAGYSTFLIKYNNAGEVQWAQLLGGSGQTYATKVAVDSAGNVYVRGSFSEDMTIGSTNLVSSIPGGSDMFAAKFDASGALLWLRRSTGADIDEGGVSVDQVGNVYVTGWFLGNTVSFDGISLTNVGSYDAFVAKYNSSGEIQWARRAGGTGLDLYWDVALDQLGNPYVAGVLSSDAVAPSGSGGAIIAKYSPSGAVQWANSASGPPASPVASVAAKCAVDSAGSCYVAGWYQTPTTFGTNTLQAQRYWNFFLAKVNSTPLTLQIACSNSLPRLLVSGEINTRFALEYVAALAASNNWQNLGTNTISSNPLTVTDTNAAGSSNRFYRARLVP